MAAKYHTLTRQAENDLENITNYSLENWGNARTDKYLEAILEGSERIGKEHKMLQARCDLAADSGLLVYKIEKHYAVCYPVTETHVLIITYLGQRQDVPDILTKNSIAITREIAAFNDRLARAEISLPSNKE